MENETTVVKALIAVFIIGLISVTAICLGDYYKNGKIDTDTIEVPIVETNIYNFK
jgi:hypothetical protein